MQEQIIDIALQDGTSTKITSFTASDVKNSNTLIVIFPAMGVASFYYKPLATSLAQKGLTVIMADVRGHGHSSVRPSRKVDYGYHEMIEVDYVGILKKVEELYPHCKKYLLGHSLGGQIASLYLSKYPTAYAGLILVACCSVYYQSWKGSAKYGILAGTQMARLVSSIFGYYPGKQLGFAGTEGRTVMKDWSRQARTGKYLVENNSHDFEASLKQMNVPTLVISFQGDKMAPKAAVEHLYQKFSPQTAIQHHHVQGKNGLRYSHFNWVKKSEEVVDLIGNFVDYT